MKASTFVQRHKVGVAGSFINQMMSNNNSLPVVGQGATEMHYTDRDCYEVVEVSADYKTVKLEALEAKPRVIPSPIGHQDWVFEPTGSFCTIVWKWGSWKRKYKAIEFTKEFLATVPTMGAARSLTDEQREQIYKGHPFPQVAVEGITKEVTKYSNIRIFFGSKDYYYDWSF